MRGARVTTSARMGAPALLAALFGAMAWLLGASGAHASETLTRTFSPAGAEQSWVVPAGVTTLGVRAVGGRGRDGGEPAEVTGQIAVVPGQTLYVEVGGTATGQGGGFNGGGKGGDAAAGGGGGASDVRTVPRSANETESLKSRLIVAGAGGGGSSTGEEGGAAGAEGNPTGEGGKPGTQTKGGEAAFGFDECEESHEREGMIEPATDGARGVGGRGESCQTKFHGGSGGGGGGGGLFGGGGGSAEFTVEGFHVDRGSGGGGGSSLVPSGGTSKLTAGEPALVELSYPRAESPPVVATGGTSSVTAHAPGTIQPGQTFTTLTVTTPVHAAGKFNLTLTSPGGTSEVSKKYVFDFSGISVTGVSPGSGPRAGGTSVTVTGTGFEPGAGLTAFKFGKALATGVECASTTQCTMTSPAASKAGSASIVASVGKAKSKKSPEGVFVYE